MKYGDVDYRFTLYRRAIDCWGKDAQVAVATEELSELIRAVSRVHTPRRYDEENVIEEIADTCIVLEQLAVIFDCKVEVMWRLFDWGTVDNGSVSSPKLRRSLGQLIVLLSDYYEGEIDKAVVARLIGDCYALAVKFGVEYDERVLAAVDFKLDRLQKRLEADENRV